MIITNDCLQNDTLSVEVEGHCVPITQIINGEPQIHCDELMVCIGPHLVSLNDLIMNVYDFVQEAQNENRTYFTRVLVQYSSLYNFFMKCCSDIIGRLTRIEKRINNLIVVRKILIKEPPKIETSRNFSASAATSIPRPPVTISEERYVIDQSINGGYIDAYVRYGDFGSTKIDPYVFWLKKEEGFIRKLMPKEVPYSKGSLLANLWIENIQEIFVENDLVLDEVELKYKGLDVRFSFKIPKLSSRWIVSGRGVFDLGGRDLLKSLPIIYDKAVDNIILKRITKYRVDERIKPVIGYEPLFLTYEVLDKKTGTIRLFEAGVNHWIKYS